MACQKLSNSTCNPRLKFSAIFSLLTSQTTVLYFLNVCSHSRGERRPVYNESFYSSGHPPPPLPNCIQGTPFNLFPELPGDNSHEFSAKTNTDCDPPTHQRNSFPITFRKYFYSEDVNLLI